MTPAMHDRIERRVRAIAAEHHISEQDARKLLGRRAGKKSGIRRRQKQLLTQPTLPTAPRPT